MATTETNTISKRAMSSNRNNSNNKMTIESKSEFTAANILLTHFHLLWQFLQTNVHLEILMVTVLQRKC